MSAASSTRAAMRKGRCERGVFDLRLSEVLWLLGFNVLLFESPIQNSTGFTYVDEIMTLCLLAAAALKISFSKVATGVLGPKARAAVLLMLAVVCLGLLGNAAGGVQTQAAPILIDLFTCVKFPVALVSACIVFSGSNALLFRAVEMEAKAVVAVLFVLGIANLFVDFGMGSDPRYGLRASFMAVFGHPTYLVFACVGLSVVLLANWRRNIPWVFIVLVVIALSLRSKGLVYAALVVVLLVLFSRRNRLSVLHIVVCAVLALLIAYDQFEAYFQTDGFARTELLRTSFEVAGDYAPFGSGFATYGSAVTAETQYYSSLYYHYGLSTVWGLTPERANFLSDTFWPTVLGQFGWAGLVLYVGMLVVLFAFAYELNSATRLAVLCCFLYLAISSTSESAFFNPQSVYLAVCLSLAMRSVAAAGPGLGSGADSCERSCNSASDTRSGQEGLSGANTRSGAAKECI